MPLKLLLPIEYDEPAVVDHSNTTVAGTVPIAAIADVVMGVPCVSKKDLVDVSKTVPAGDDIRIFKGAVPALFVTTPSNTK